jgi:hypothetical protein
MFDAEFLLIGLAGLTLDQRLGHSDRSLKLREFVGLFRDGGERGVHFGDVAVDLVEGGSLILYFP